MESNMEKKNKNNKKIAIIALALIAISAAVFVVRGHNSSKITTIAFYGIGEREANGIISEIERITPEKKFNFVKLENDKDTKAKSADKEFEKKIEDSDASLVFVKSGRNVKGAIKLAKKKSQYTRGISEEMPTSIRAAIVKDDNGLTAIPVLGDHMEIDIDMVAFRNSGMEGISTWEDIENLAVFQKRYVDFPIVFAGKDPELAMDVFGAFTEALSGTDEYESAVKIMNANSGETFNAPRLARLLTEKSDDPLFRTVLHLKNLYKKGLLNPNTFNLTKADVNAFARARIASIIIMSLDDHRNYSYEVISRFSSIYFPSKFHAGERKFVAPLTYAIPLSKDESVHNIISALVSTESQEKVSSSTGLAPVLSHSRTPDKQASDVRRWVAATDAPLSGFSKDTNLTKTQQIQLVAELAALITAK